MPYIKETHQIKTKVLGVTQNEFNSSYDKQEILELMKKDSALVETVYLVDFDVYARVNKKDYILGGIKRDEYSAILSMNKATIIAWFITGGFNVEKGLTIEKMKYGLNLVIHLSKKN